MTRRTSNPFKIEVRQPPAFGAGTEAGSFADDLWTPGRDANGLVNRVSWDLVPVGRWVEVASTRLDALDAVVKAAIPGWADYGSGDWLGVTHAWNGVAIDTALARFWWLCAGGHADSSNNGIYRFDAFKMAYTIEKLPSDTNLWSSAYRAAGTFTHCPESEAAHQAAVDAGTWNSVNDWFYDEVYWDRVPTARHTYGGALYLPDTNELILAVRRLWRFSLGTGLWTHKSVATSATSGAYPGMGEECIAYKLKNENKLMLTSCGSGTPWGGMFDLDTGAWSANEAPWFGWDWSGAADTRDQDRVTLFRVPQKANGSYASPGRYMVYDLDGRTVLASGNVQFAAGLSQADFAADDSYYDGPGMVFAPTLNEYWVLTATVANTLAWFKLDPTTAPWTLSPMTQQGRVPALSNGINVNRRMGYLPTVGAIFFMGSADKNISLYRLF